MLVFSTLFLSLLLLPTEASSHGDDLRYARRHENNDARLAPQQTPTTQNSLMLQGFEWYSKKDEQHWNRLNSQLQTFSGLGVDTLWIPPLTKAGANPSTGYDVYDLWDLGEFNQSGHIATSYGTKKQLLDLSDSARSLGISLLIDAVLNQRSGAESPTACQAHKVNPTNRLESISNPQEIQAWVNFRYPGRGKKYSNKTWGCNDFSAVDYDSKSKENAVWKINGQNNAFARDVSSENGNYDFLILADVAYENPSVREDVKAWGTWITNELNPAGFRLDAAKHISRFFLNEWVSSVRSQTGKSDLLFVAEYLSTDVSTLQSFTDDFNTTISIFDTPLQSNLHSLSTGSQTDLPSLFNNTWLSTRPTQSITYINNHDTQPSQSLSTLNINGWFLPLAYSLVLLRDQGTPCIFYGDLYGTYNASNTFTPAIHASAIADMALARRYFAYGVQTDYFTNTTGIGWTRQGDQDHPDGLAVVMSIAQGGTQKLRMNVGGQHAGEVWSSLFGDDGNLTIDGQGWAEFVAGAGTVNMFARADVSQRGEFGKWNGSSMV